MLRRNGLLCTDHRVNRQAGLSVPGADWMVYRRTATIASTYRYDLAVFDLYAKPALAHVASWASNSRTE